MRAKSGFNIIKYAEAKEFLLPRHYSGRIPNIMHSFGYYQDGALVAVCTFGKPASNSLCVGVCGIEFSSKVVELNRLCVDGLTEITLSKFVSTCLKSLGDCIVVSYADTGANHTGYIYQATNFIYTGATKQRTDKYVPNGKHSRHYDKNAVEEFRKVRTSKHRYIYFCGSKSFRRMAFKNLNYAIEDYPKGVNKRYILGEYLKDKIVKK